MTLADAPPMTTSAATAPALEVRPIQSPAEYRACQAVQRRAWGIEEDGYVVPVATMAAAQRVGGLVLGAFRGGQLVGFSFAFLGRVHGTAVLYSQLTAVDPGAQSGGVGGALKTAQRQWAREQGLATIAWTFDPLQAGNAAFNLQRLGARSRTYEVDLYGPRTDRLNAGLATDRLLAEWPTDERATTRPDGAAWEDAPPLIETEQIHADFYRPHTMAVVSAATPSRVRLPIPASIEAVKSHDPALARAWQLAVRQAFQSAFSAGYVAYGFQRGALSSYLLERP